MFIKYLADRTRSGFCRSAANTMLRARLTFAHGCWNVVALDGSRRIVCGSRRSARAMAPRFNLWIVEEADDQAA